VRKGSKLRPLIAILCLLIAGVPLSVALPQLSLTVYTSASSYNGGDVVTVYGRVTDTLSAPVGGAQVSLQVTAPGGGTIHVAFVYSAPDGSYLLQFGLQATAPSGYYTAYATASKSGYSSSSNSTIFVVPRITLANWLQNGLVFAAPLSVVFYYPDWDPSRGTLKPPGVTVAQLTDWTATGFPYGASTFTQVDALDTDSVYVDLASGAPKVSGSSIIAMSGPAVHAIVHYYEQTETAPLRFGYDSTNFYFFKKDGTQKASLPLGVAGSLHQDVFILELFNDMNGNKVLIGYGFTWKGTFAAGVYLKSRVLPNAGAYVHAWYIFSWVDGSGGGAYDGFVDLVEVSGPLALGD